MSDKIKEIRDRVEQDVAKGPANKEIYRVHKDRAFLLAERIAQARWRYFTWIRGPYSGDPSWMDLSQDARDTLLNESRQILSALKAAGLAVVEREDGR